MLELTIGKCDYMSEMNNTAFNVDVIYYPTNGCVTDMRVPKRVCSGAYITDMLKGRNCGTSIVLDALDKAGMLTKPIILFNMIHITRELTSTEKKNREALEQFFKVEVKNPELKVGGDICRNCKI